MLVRRRFKVSVLSKVTVSFAAVALSCTSPARASIIPQPNINLNFLRPKEKLPEAWFGGSNVGYSPAFVKGKIGYEPYFIGNIPMGHLGPNGGQHHGSTVRSFTQDQWMKAALTDRISVLYQPTWSVKADNGHSSVQLADMPIDFEYRLTKDWAPSLTAFMGFRAPTGSYKNLANSLDSSGSGTFDLRYGGILQFVQPLFHRPLRFRIWAFGRTPISSAKLRNITAYGTEKGFKGRAHVGPYGTEGITMEYGIRKKWILGLDLYSDWASSTRVKGRNIRTHTTTNTRTGWSTDYNVGPTIEYSPTNRFSAVFELIVTVAGHNAERMLTPELGLYYEWG